MITPETPSISSTWPTDPLRPDIDPRQLVYLPADGMRAKDLGRAIALGRALTRSVDQPATRLRVWLLDEVTSIDGWTTTIKYLRDNSIFGEETVVCTGSSWSETGDVERDLLAGRAGSSSVRRSRLLLPMGFRDVLKVTAHQIPLPVPVAPWNLQGQETATAAATLEPFTDELDLAWQAYLTSGGFRAPYPNITVLARSASPLCETLRPGCTSTLIERPRSIRSRF
jgi:uncharacterized protein